MRITSLIIAAFLFACNGGKKHSNSAELPISVKGEEDTIQTPNPSKPNKTTAIRRLTKEKKKNNSDTGYHIDRYMEFPGDENFNGKPMTQQIEILQKILAAQPDTLINMAKHSYVAYKGFYPVSVADNFEEGISTEHIHYPKIIFRYEVYEDEKSAKPYLIKQITIFRERNGFIRVLE